MLERMKTRSQKAKAAKITRSRWLAYATAGAATALAGVSSADSEIHYSGRVDFQFAPDDNKTERFPLDQPGDSIVFGHKTGGRPAASFQAIGLRSAAFVGFSLFEYASVSRLKRAKNHYVSDGSFAEFYDLGYLYQLGGLGQWRKEGTSFVGFRFNSGAGRQYGWARVHMGGGPLNWGFIVLDYAYADPGEPIRPGQTTSSTKDDVSEEGSVGLLAFGAVGLTLWRERRQSFTR
jgi:hypothetical protein